MNPLILGPLIDIVKGIIDKVVPDKEGREKAKQEIELEMLKRREEIIHAAQQSDAGQIEVNKIEAASPDLFRGGWRPAIGWVGVFGMGYQWVIRPFLVWFSPVLEMPEVPPVLDLADLITMIGGMLGLATLRTIDKKNGVS
jgi:hypothetical protein